MPCFLLPRLSTLLTQRSLNRNLCQVSCHVFFQDNSSSLFQFHRDFHSSRTCNDRSFTNFLADEIPPAVQVASISENGIQLMDGLVIQGPCVFLEGKVFLWDVPSLDLTLRKSEEQWKGWTEEKFKIFNIVKPRPGGFSASISSTFV